MSPGAELRGWSWAPDGASMVFGLRVDSEARLYRADVESGSVADLGIEDAQFPAVSAHTGMMAFVHRRPQFGLYRVERGTGEWRRLFASSGRDSQPTLSPDGTQIVFTSDRSGRFELWWARLDAPDSLRPIEGVRPDTRQSPVWSPDGERLLITALDATNAPVILEVEPARGRIDPVETHGHRAVQAIYGPGDTLFLLEDGDLGATALVAYRRGSASPGGRIEGVSHVQFDAARDRVLYTRLDANGLWSAPPSLAPGAIAQLSDRIPSRWRYRSWSLAEDGDVAYLDATPACWTRLSRYSVDANALAPHGEDCVDPVTRSTTNGFSARDGAWFVSLASEDGSDIGFMPLPEAKRTHEGLAKWLISPRRKAS